jgi:hypothetical protein
MFSIRPVCSDSCSLTGRIELEPTLDSGGNIIRLTRARELILDLCHRADRPLRDIIWPLNFLKKTNRHRKSWEKHIKLPFPTLVQRLWFSLISSLKSIDASD